MGANDKAVIEQEQYDEVLRNAINKKWLARRADIAAGDEVALRNTENDLLTHFVDTGALKSLIRTAFTNNSETTGREFFRIAKGMLVADAEAEATRELSPPSRKPIGDATRAAVDAAQRALAQLGS